MPVLENDFVVTGTTAGTLRGIRFRGIESFLGVPYGATTAGNGRFAPPRPVEPWSGVREALSFGDAAPQVDTRLGSANSAQDVHDLMYVKGGHPLDGSRMSEDCLNLNVWTPSSTDDAKRPVMVWFHGGGFVHGSAGSALYNGDHLAHVGDVVVVTVNARLGLMGFLPLDFIEGDGFRGASNAGMLDLVAALQWVRDNIAAFGGDPENVTIFGQSGGGGKANVLLGMPSAQGLFHRIINMSGPVLAVTEPAAAAQLAAQTAEAAGISAGDVEAWRDMPLRELLEIQRRISPPLGAAFGMEMVQAPATLAFGWAPVLDGEFVTAHPFSDGAPPAADGIPMLLGFASHDPSLLMVGNPAFPTLNEATALELAAANFGPAGTVLLQKIMAEHPNEPVRLQYARVVNSHTFAAAAIAIAETKAAQTAPVFLYEFAHTSDVLDGLLGATHSLDLPFAFNNVDRAVFAGTAESRHETSRNMALAWTAFARTRNPCHTGIPMWPAYDAGRRRMIIGPDWETASQDD
ncbi:carboxylesterase/lipase family protein [Pseudarthrobacter sulfonivorans]|uniref:carboxylesterase/lipase family protein n=1 Tax=Pseudarthrobacter sulfonivorans TaxID=121292 RepID=UPI002104A3AA|nr:carboxylesterase family protein [Pseudarthrobacter sulfonivorans]